MRRTQNLTQQELGDMIGLHRAAISRLETGCISVTLETIVLLAAGLGTTPSELLEGIGISLVGIHSASALVFGLSGEWPADETEA